MLPPLGDDLRAQTGAVAVIPVALGLLGAAAGIWTLARGSEGGGGGQSPPGSSASCSGWRRQREA